MNYLINSNVYIARCVFPVHNQFEPEEVRSEIRSLIIASFLIRYMCLGFGVASTLPIHENTVEVLAQTEQTAFTWRKSNGFTK
jgi:hypothetical protein